MQRVILEIKEFTREPGRQLRNVGAAGRLDVLLPPFFAREVRLPQKTLNRGEAYHRLRHVIAFVNGGKLRVDTESEQQLWNECARLIANAIIHYKTALLSCVHEQKRAAGDEAAMALVAGMSPIAWRHINLFGAMDFGAATAPVDIDALASYYADLEYWARMLRAAAVEKDSEG